MYIHQGYTTHITWLQYGYYHSTTNWYIKFIRGYNCLPATTWLLFTNQVNNVLLRTIWLCSICASTKCQQCYFVLAGYTIRLYTLYMFGCSRILLTMWVFVQQILQETRCQSGLQYGDLVLPVIICYSAMVVHCTSIQCGKPNNKRTICGWFFTIRLWPLLKWLYSH